MYIKNICSGILTKRIKICSIILILWLSLLMVYFLINKTSVTTFFQTITQGTSSLLLNNNPYATVLSLLYVIIPLVLIVYIIINLIKRQNSLKKFKQPFNIKAIKFTDNLIFFNFFSPKYNFSCKYSDIEKLHTVIIIEKRPTPTKYRIKEIVLHFTALNGKTFTIKNDGGFLPEQFLYRIIDCARQIKDFSYSLSGEYISSNLDNKIQRYKSNTHKTSDKLLTILTIISIAGFLAGICTLIIFKNLVIEELKNNQYTYLIIMVLISMLPFISDIILPAFAYKDKKKEFVLFKIIIITVCFLPFLSINYDKDVLQYIDNIKSHLKEGQSICGNLPRNYNNLSKEEILRQREKQVERSIFNPPNYQPSEEIFGEITANNNPSYDRTAGNSVLSKYINNPNVLIGIDYAFNLPVDEDKIQFCKQPVQRLMPSSFTYYKNKKLIIAKYKIHTGIINSTINYQGQKIPYLMTLNGLNARDLGYEYGYALRTRNIKMFKDSSIQNKVYKFNDSINIGSTYGIPDGYNTISPEQKDLYFTLTGLPAQITLKLWKEKPSKRSKRADFYYTIILENGYSSYDNSVPRKRISHRRTTRRPNIKTPRKQFL